MNPAVEHYFSNLKSWKKELEQLRIILLDCLLTEELKWGTPCYMFKKSNVILIGGFKEYCMISFIKGALLSDTHKLLLKPGENSQSARIIKFNRVEEITEIETILKSYIFETIELEKVGVKVEFKKNSDFQLPEELQNKLDGNTSFKNAFSALTPGRQRGYILYFSAPKQSSTRVSRVEKNIQRILDGKGLNDCTCGLSQKMPNCDGSHNKKL